MKQIEQEVTQHFCQLPFDFDVIKLQSDLQKCLSIDWQDHYRTSDFEGDWKIIALRAVGGLENIIYPTPSSDFYKDTDLLLSLIHI